MLSDIEKPLSELETSISKFSSFTERHDLDVGNALDTLHDLMPQFERKLYANLSAWDIVQLARHPQRPFPLDYINAIFSDVIELHGDRHNADDQTIFGGFARLDSLDVMLIATRQGRNPKQNILCNFGCAMPEGFRKALRLMRLAEKARTPIITFVDTPGAFPGVASEERNVSEAIAMNLREMFRLTVPIICVITGDGMVGFVDQVGLNHCVVKTVIHMDFNASATVSRTREAVVACGSFELASDGLLKVAYLENDADVKRGDVILTNGGAYPPDLILGRVEDFRQESHGISSYAAIRPAVDFTRLSTVFVVKDFNVEN